MIGYKATDMNGCCRGFQFEVGKTYRKDVKKEDMKCCTDTVFHFCRELIAIERESNYSLRTSRLFEVIAGDYVQDGDKFGTNELTIIREIEGLEKEKLLRNSGSFNSGRFNSGNYNSGNYNSGNCNSGYFNSNSPLIRIFNKETSLKISEIKFPHWLYFNLTVWVSHDTATDEEKINHKEEIEICGGFLKTLEYKEAFKRAYEKTTDDEKKQLFLLPNFDCEIFEEISGIDTRADYKRLYEDIKK